jgi:DNA-binding response OmpR family regulator
MSNSNLNSPRATILAVDDTPESLALLVKILTPAGYQVRPADSGELALAAVTANPPDLILLDVRMKGVGGLEVCRRLKAGGETRHIPIILISAFADLEEWVEGLQMGAADYITKPFQAEELLSRVKTQLSLSRANVSLEQQGAALRQTNERLQSEIVERRRIEDELRQSLDRAERSRRALLSTLEDQKRVEEAVRTSEAQLSNALQMMRAGHWVYDVGRDLFTFNDHFYSIFRTSAAEVGGYQMSSADYARRFCHPDDAAVVGRETRAAVESTDPNFSRQIEHRVLFAGGEVGHIAVRFFIVKDPHARTVKTFGVNQDITERKRAEEALERSRAELLQAQKMEAVGRLAGGVAHNFNNILQAMLSQAEALRIAAGSPELAEAVAEIEAHIRRGASLTQQLLLFSRRQASQRKRLDLGEVVSAGASMLHRLVP